MFKVAPSQIKAARALLGWSQKDLANAAGLSEVSIRRVELGYALRDDGLQSVDLAIQSAGIEFTAGRGVRHRDAEVQVLKGTDSCDQLFAIIERACRHAAQEVLLVIKNSSLLDQFCGYPARTNLERLTKLGTRVRARCLLSQHDKGSQLPNIECRTIPDYAIGPSTCFIFGDSYAHIFNAGHLEFFITCFTFGPAAASYHKEFSAQWERGVPCKASH